MELFNIIKVIFNNPKEWKEVSNLDKRKNFFMLNRFFSINYPLQANALQHMRINQVMVIEYWFKFLSSKFNRTPGWIFTKGVKKNKEEKEKKLTITNDEINEYCKLNKIDRKMVDDALIHFQNDMISEIKSFTKIIKQ